MFLLKGRLPWQGFQVSSSCLDLTQLKRKLNLDDLINVTVASCQTAVNHVGWQVKTSSVVHALARDMVVCWLRCIVACAQTTLELCT